MRREAFAAEGNPLFMGGPVMFVRGGGAAPPPEPTLDEQVEAILAGTTGFVFDPLDMATIFSNAGFTGPITVFGTTVGSMVSKWGTTSIGVAQTSLAMRATNTPEGLLFDGVDDRFDGDLAFRTFYSGLPAFYTCHRVQLDRAPLTAAHVFSVARSAGGFLRHIHRVEIAGHLTAGFARTDGNAQINLADPAQFALLTPVTIGLAIDFAGGTGSTLSVNGTEVNSNTQPLPAGVNSDSLLTQRVRLGANWAGSAAEFWPGILGRVVFCPFIPTPEQRAVFEAWVGETPPPPPLSEQVEAILAGTTGFALDPQDVSTLWRDTAATIPVTAAGNPVALMRSKWGTAVFDFRQATAARVPTWDGVGSILYDGVDDLLDATPPILVNLPAAFVCCRALANALAGGVLVYFSTTVAASHRFALATQPTGALSGNVRRLNADVRLDLFSPAGAVQIGVEFTSSLLANYAGTGAVTGRKDGVEAFAGVLANAVGNSDPTDSLRNNIGAYSTGSSAFWDGLIGRVVFCPFVPTPEQRAVFEAWVGETP